MRLAIIESDVVVNVVNANEGWVDPKGRETIEAGELGKGSYRVDGVWFDPHHQTLEDLRSSASLSAMEFMLRLEQMGLYDQVEAVVYDEATPRAVKIMWEKASAFERMNETLVQMAQVAGFTEQQLDEVFSIVIEEE